MRQCVVEIECQLGSQSFTHRQTSGVVPGASNAAESSQSSVLRLKEHVREDSQVVDVELMIRPIVTIEISGCLIDGLGRGQRRITKVIQSQIRKQILEVGDLGNG